MFNMGIGMIIICSQENSYKITSLLSEAMIIGKVVEQVGTSRVVIDGIGYHKDKIN